ncbi:MAG: hypothetical protein LQ342_007942 [Letrouitia transgressa]|nr:MAG: hypothetical protein LQ342_007942 [Letrouitia transgressa]
MEKALVDYPDSDESDSPAATGSDANKSPENGKGRLEPPSFLPPLPEAFHNLYASKSRTSNQDDPSLHEGRQRHIPHVEGNWPTHVYIEWHPSKTESDLLFNLLAKADDGTTPKQQIRSSLMSELGSEQPLHISLSLSLTLKTHERQSFIDALTTEVINTGVRPFDIRLANLDWAANYDRTRWFLVLQALQPSNDELNRLLQASNSVAERFGQLALYSNTGVSGQHPVLTHELKHLAGKEKLTEVKNPAFQGSLPHKTSNSESYTSLNRFHISIGWTLEQPPISRREQVRAIGSIEISKLGIHVDAVKVKEGNTVHSISLTSMIQEVNETIGS